MNYCMNVAPTVRVFKVCTRAFTLLAITVLVACSPSSEPVQNEMAPAIVAHEFDVLIKGGTVYDGSGGEGQQIDVALIGDSIAAMGSNLTGTATAVIDAQGLAVAPGFINMLSWADSSLIEDGRGQSDIRQGVTLEIFGEGSSMGPITELMRGQAEEDQGDIKYPVTWTTLDEYLTFLTDKGISPNVASFVGATTLRVHQIGYEDRAPTTEELETMTELVREAMRDGALGLGTSLIYAPAFYAKTDELVALAKAASEFDGMYISHLRSEGARLLEALDELIHIAREADMPAEVYHLKMSGRSNWDKFDAVVEKIEAARAEGLAITTDMYNYTAGATGLDAAMPPWVQEGGYKAWANRLKDPEIRSRVIAEMRKPAMEWENFFYESGPDGMLLSGFKNRALKKYTGMTLTEVAKQRETSPADTVLDLVIEDGSRVGTIYFLMSEENVRKQTALPWMSFGSDASAPTPQGVFLESNPHPRAYGNFARLLGKYVREEGALSLGEAVRRLSNLPATNLKLKRRGKLTPGYFADVVLFDPEKIQDNATFAEPHQYATGMVHVFVNGTQVLKDGDHTGATPGRVLRGPGWRGWQ